MPSPELIITETIDLPYVEGQLSSYTEYDDSVDVSVEHAAYGAPAANLRLTPGGPCDFVIMGFTTGGLREMAKLLNDAADAIDVEAKLQKEIE